MPNIAKPPNIVGMKTQDPTSFVIIQGNELTDTIRAILKEELAINQSSKKDTNFENRHELLTRKSAAAFLKISISTLNRHIKSGIIPVQHFGTSIRIKKMDLIKG